MPHLDRNTEMPQFGIDFASENQLFRWWQGYEMETVPELPEIVRERLTDVAGTYYNAEVEGVHSELQFILESMSKVSDRAKKDTTLFFSGFSEDVMGQIAPNFQTSVNELRVLLTSSGLSKNTVPIANAETIVADTKNITEKHSQIIIPKQRNGAKEESLNSTEENISVSDEQIIPYLTESILEYALALAVDTEDDPEWRKRGLCSQTDPEAFFPEKGGSTRDAKKVCLSCDVRGECLKYALDHDERFGVWGGLSERERRSLKKLMSK